MGNWHISIRGAGVHHNHDLPEDADRMAQKFVEDLRAAGHSIVSAAITYGSEQQLIPPPPPAPPPPAMRAPQLPPEDDE